MQRFFFYLRWAAYLLFYAIIAILWAITWPGRSRRRTLYGHIDHFHDRRQHTK